MTPMLGFNAATSASLTASCATVDLFSAAEIARVICRQGAAE
jgi:hypothetical protein